MTRSIRPLLLSIALATLSLQAQAQALITQAESDAEQAHLKQGILMTKDAMPGAPKIDVLEPNLSADLVAPLQIRVKFITEAGATLVPSSLRVYYGVFGIDITERLLKRAKFENDMLVLDRAEIPPGHHRLLLKIKDTADRVSEKLLTLTVTK